MLLGAVQLRAVRTVKITLFVPSERARASTQAGRRGARLIMSGAVCLRDVRAASNELFVHSERIRAVTQGVYIYT